MHATLLHAVATLVSSLVLTTAPPAAPQDAAEDTPPTGQDVLAELADYQPLGYERRLVDLRGTRKRIADAMVQYRTLGKAAEALDKLEREWVAVSSNHTYEEQYGLLVQVAMARAELLAEMGDTQGALRAVTQLLPDASDPRWKEHEGLQPAGERLLAVARVAEQDPLLQAVRARILEMMNLPAPAAVEREDSLQAVIEEAIDREDWNMVREIGSRAAPHVIEAILRKPDDFDSNPNSDPVFHLVQMAEQKAAVDLLAHIDAGGYLWKRRILRAMTLNHVLENFGTWTATKANGSGVVCLEPAWIGILESFLRTPDTARDCLPHLKQVLVRDALTPGLQAAMVAALDSGASDVAHSITQMLNDSGGATASEKPVLEHLARGEDPFLRKYAARKLAEYEASNALLELAADPDAEIRTLVASTLRRERIVSRRTAFVTGASRTDEEWTDRILGEPERRALTLLVADDVAEVRAAALPGLVELGGKEELESLRRLVDDPSPAVRATLARHAGMLPPTMGAEILVGLARDREKVVLEDVDQELKDVYDDEVPLEYVPAVLQRLRNDARAFDKLGGTLVKIISGLPAGMRMLTEAALTDADDRLVKLLVERAQPDAYEHVTDDARVAALVRRAEAAAGYGEHIIQKCDGRDGRPGAMLHVLADRKVPPHLRMRAAETAARQGGDAFRTAMLALLADPAWQVDEARRYVRQYTDDIAKNVPLHERNAFLLAVVSDPRLPDDLSEDLVMKYEPSLPQGKEITMRVLDRWLQGARAHRATVRKALAHLATLPGEFEPELLIGATRIPEVADVAVQAMGQLRDPRYLGTLGRCLSAEWINEELYDRSEVRQYAAQALTGYFSDEALTLLLQGLKTTDTDVWNACTRGIETIEEYQRRAAEWEDRTQVRRTPQSAVAELAAMLEDQDPLIRAEAAKGLATLDAVEYIPVLIRMLKSDTDEVKAAVRTALDRLNSPPKGTGTLGKLLEEDETTAED